MDAGKIDNFSGTIKPAPAPQLFQKPIVPSATPGIISQKGNNPGTTGVSFLIEKPHLCSLKFKPPLYV